MSTFLQEIIRDPAAVKQTKKLSKKPFENLVPSKGNDSDLFGYHCDITYIKPDSLKSLKKYGTFLPLHKLSIRSPNTYYCAACIISVKELSLKISDLRTTFRKIKLQYPLQQNFRPHDIILFANAKIIDSNSIYIHSDDQIIKVGHNNSIHKCSHYNPKENCSLIVDTRKNPICDCHCHTLFKEASSQRMILRGAVHLNEEPKKEKKDFSHLNKPLPENPQELENYLVFHGNLRKQRILQSIKSPLSSPILGQGFSTGDIIPL